PSDNTLIIQGDSPMSIRKANATWNGNLKDGKGTIAFAAQTMPYTFKSRFEEGTGTNPEELIAAAHSGCYSMALSHMLAEAGHTPTNVTTEAAVTFGPVDGAPTISKIHLTCKATVPGLDKKTFDTIAAEAKKGCPISRALAAVEITLDA